MSKRKRSLTMLLALCLVLCLAACSGSDTPAKAEKPADIGYYTLTSMTEGSDTYGAEMLALIGADKWYIELREDYTGTLGLGEDIEEFTWKPGAITDGADTLSYTLEGDTLTLKGDSYEMVFTRSTGTPPAASTIIDPGVTDPAEAVEGSLVETGFFSFSYGGDWVCNFEGLDDYDNYAYAEVNLPDPDSDWPLVSVTITVKTDEPFRFAYDLYGSDMDFYAALNEDAYETTTIGGMPFWVADGGYCTEYFGYDQASNTFTTIYVSDSEYLEQAQEIISTLQFTCPAYSGEVTPLYWEGEPYSVAPHSTNVGGFPVESIQLYNDTAYPTYDIFGSRVAVTGDTYYVLNDGVIEEYTRSGDELTYLTYWPLPFEPEELFVDANGTPCISDFMEGLVRLDSETGDGTTVAPDVDYVMAHPSGQWGISYFSGPEIARVDFATGAVQNITLPGISTVNYLAVTENYVLISATLDDADNTACLKIYDFDFRELGGLDKTSTTTGYYGSVSAVAETGNGLMVFDGNMRDVYFLDNTLALIAAVDMDTLVGTDYPWPCGAVTLDDGSVILCVTDGRADDSADETILFQLSGF